MTWALIGAATITTGGAIGSKLLSGSGDSSDANFYSDHNKARIAMGTEALQALAEYYKTGKLGSYQAGEAYTGDLGAYDLTDLQNISLDKLESLLTGGLPDTYLTGKNILSDFVNTDYNAATSDLYKNYRTSVMREREDAANALKRDMAFTGDLYSTETAKQTGLLNERTMDQLNTKLAELTDTNVSRRLNAANLLSQLGFQEGDYEARNIGMGMSLGDIERALADQKAKDAYAEYKRQRTEWYDTVNAAKIVAGSNGLTTTGTSQDTSSAFSSLLNTGLQLAGTSVGKSLTNLFSGSGSSSSSSSSIATPATYNNSLYNLATSPLLETYLSGSYLN